MRVHLVHPGVNWSLSDVYDGLRDGLIANGVTVVPDMADADCTIVVNGNLHEPATIRQWRSIAPVAVLCTESPYDFDQEVERIAAADAGWTHERLSVEPLRVVNPKVNYLRHAWHPDRHGIAEDTSVRAHDVVFVGTGFGERVEWFNRIDWSGIDLGLYGLWDGTGLDEHVERCVVQEVTKNAQTVALYRRATMGLNLYRRKGGVKGGPRREMPADSLNPRAYELAACGVFHCTTPRAEVDDVFGDLMPRIGGRVETAKADEGIIREWLRPEQAAERARCAAASRACVANDSWHDRAATVIADLHAWELVGVDVQV